MFKKKVTQEELGQYDYQVSYILSEVDRKIDDLASTLGYKWDVERKNNDTGETAYGWFPTTVAKKPVKRKPVKKGKK